MVNYEEKYKNALSQAKQAINNIPDKSLAKWLQSIFPELQESDDEKMRAWLIEYFDKVNDEISKDDRQKIITWLGKQGEYKSSDEVLKVRQEVYQSGYNDGYKHGCEDTKKQGEQKPAWSEEDEEMIEGLNNCLNELEEVNGWNYTYVNGKDVRLWLKSIKERYTWKPSDEQINAIKEVACYSSVFSEKTIDNLISLSKDLKKLKGE